MEISEIVDYLSLPKELGVNPDTGKAITLSNGRYGPYVASDGQSHSLPKGSDIFAVTLEEAIKLLATPKGGKKGARQPQKPFKEYGEYEGEPFGIFYGRYGYYGKRGKENFALPKEMKKDPSHFEELTKERLIELYKEALATKKQ